MLHCGNHAVLVHSPCCAWLGLELLDPLWVARLCRANGCNCFGPPADEEHLAACLHPPGEPAAITQPGSSHTLQHSATDTRLQPYHQPQQQQQPPSHSSPHAGQPGFGAEGRRRATLGGTLPVPAKHAGGMPLRPGGLPHSLSERPGSRGGSGMPGRCWL
jgi:hypothetical protein